MTQSRHSDAHGIEKGTADQAKPSKAVLGDGLCNYPGRMRIASSERLPPQSKPQLHATLWSTSGIQSAWALMAAVGTSRTSMAALSMSVLEGKADIQIHALMSASDPKRTFLVGRGWHDYFQLMARCMSSS